MSTKPWLKTYPEGIPTEIDLNKFVDIPAVLESACKRFPQRPAFSNLGTRLTYAQIDRLSRDMAAYLQQGLGLKTGDRIVIQMPNLLQYPVILFGALRAGLTVVNLNPLYTAKEMRHHIRDSGAKTIFIVEMFADKLEQIQPELQLDNIILTEVGDMLPFLKGTLVNFVLRHVKKMVPKHGLKNAKRLLAVLKQGAELPFQKPQLDHNTLAFLQYTGGTTGVAKGAMLTHGNIVANMLQVDAWLAKTIPQGEGSIVAALPLYHVFCLTVNCLAMFSNGTENILITNPRDMPGFIKTLAKERPYAMTAVSTLLQGMLNNPAFNAAYLERMLYVVCGAMPLSSAVAEAWKKRSKAPLIEGYGLTEASPLVSCNPLTGTVILGTVGLPVPSTEIAIRDDDGKEVAQGQPGELCVRGPQVMRGYWNQPEETNKVLDAQGWLMTGDVAVMDERGYLKIVDRKKDMIIVSGFNVYPNEVEEVVTQNPKVMEAAAIGVPDNHTGEAVKVFVVRRDPSLTEKEVLTWCHDRLTGYKRPKQVAFLDALPKSNVGKILRRPLRDANPSA